MDQTKSTPPGKSREKNFLIQLLEISNVKRLKALTVIPEKTGLTIFGGANKQGKSSAIDSVEYAFRGQISVCPKVIRKGMKKASVYIDCGAFNLLRTWESIGGEGRVGHILHTVTVKDREGNEIKPPQAFLDSLWTKWSYRPEPFIRAKGADRRKMLLALTGRGDEIEAIGVKRDKHFKDRTAANTLLRDAKGVLKKLKAPEVGCPRKPIDVADELAERSKLQEAIDANERARSALPVSRQHVTHQREFCVEVETKLEIKRHEVEELEKLLNEESRKLTQITSALKLAEKLTAALVDPDLSDIDDRIKNAAAKNVDINAAIAYDKADVDVDRFATRADNLTKKITVLDASRDKILDESKFPVPYLGVNDDDVTLKNMPFENLSGSQKIILSVGIGIAYNPRLRVILIDEGSGIRGDTLTEIIKVAKKGKCQVLMASAAHDDVATVVIEDGVAVGEGSIVDAS